MRTFDLTWFCNPNSYDIRRIKPYAAYDVTADEWAVKPPELPDWSWDKLPVPVQRILNAAITTARNTLKLREPDRTLQAARLYDMWHADRSNAFGPQGAGWWDLGNLREKALDQLGLWGPLYEAHKRAENLQLADWSNTPHFGALPKTQKCEYCDRQATQRVIHSEGMAYVPACDEHLDKAKDAAARCTPDGSYDPSNVDAVRKIAAGLYHWAPKDARDSIEQHGLDHRFGPARSEPQGIFFHHDLDRARDWVPGIEKTHDLYEVDGHGLRVHPDPYDTDDASYTAQPVPPERIRRLAVTGR